MHDFRREYEAQNRAQEISESDPFTERRYIQFHRHFIPGARTVLDVGCNTGRGGQILQQIDPTLIIWGLDCVPERLNALSECYANKILGVSTEIPLPDRSVDVIVAGEFLEHLYPGDVDRTLSEFQRILVIGGRLLLTTPNPNYILNRLRGRTVYGVSHLTQHIPKILQFRIAMHGFSRIKIKGSGKVSNLLGESMHLLPLYGSYLLSADKW